MLLKEIINKYPTDINVESISTALQNKNLFELTKDKNTYTLEDVQKPVLIEKDGLGYKAYEYTIGKYTLKLKYKNNDYRTFQAELRITNNNNPESNYVLHWMYDGSRGKQY